VAPLDNLDLFELKRRFAQANEWLDAAGALRDLRFLAHARRALLPLPLVDRRDEGPIDGDSVFPPFASRPAPGLEGKRIAVIGSGGGGACVAIVGAARAFEEAGVKPHLVTACSGSAIWGSMWAAGMNAAEMASFSLGWRPEDYLDVQWTRLPAFLVSALRGFSGLAKGEAIEHLVEGRLEGMTAGETEIPLETVVYNLDRGVVEYFGTKNTPDVRVSELMRIAIALPLFIEAVRVHDHLYVDGGVVDMFPAQPVIEDGGFDLALGLNFMLPADLEPEEITGWDERPMGLMTASRQVQQGAFLELARRQRDELGDKLVLLTPVDPALLHGVSFYDLFIDRSRWPEMMRAGYDAASAALDRWREGADARADSSASAARA
jgi:NTE family protein